MFKCTSKLKMKVPIRWDYLSIEWQLEESLCNISTLWPLLLVVLCGPAVTSPVHLPDRAPIRTQNQPYL